MTRLSSRHGWKAASCLGSRWAWGRRWILRLLLLGLFAWVGAPGKAHGAASVADSSDDRVGTVVSWEGAVEVLRASALTWDPARADQPLYPGDALKTGERSRVVVRLRDGSVVRWNEYTQATLGVRPERAWVRLLRGMLSFFHRDEPGHLEVENGGVSAIIRGTEFVVSVEGEGSMELLLWEGEVEMRNQWGRVTLHSGEGGRTRPEAAPELFPVLESRARDAVQWLLYYPAILAPGDLGEFGQSAPGWRTVATALRLGDVRGAREGAATMARAGIRADTSDEHLLDAAVALSTGQVEEALNELDAIRAGGLETRVASALRRLVRAVASESDGDAQATEPRPDAFPDGGLATEWMAWSYVRQRARDLEGALRAARRAVEIDPGFGMGWARVAELEFGFGRQRPAREAVQRALSLAPAQAQATALQGFLHSAGRSEAERTLALASFERAMAVDPALGNAWLGRGLVRWRSGDIAGGLEDLTMAVALEPRRSLPRTYLGRLALDLGDESRARQELALAERLDPLDPSIWLQRALLDQTGNRINEALRDLARAAHLGDQGVRGIQRSEARLDEDRAVTGAQQAVAYRDAGWEDIGRREAGRAAAQDPTSAAAHLFLADSYAGESDVRWEAARVGEYLQANLLAPVGAGLFSSTWSDQEYSRLLERDGHHVFARGGYRSTGDWEQAGGAWGTTGRWGYLADAWHSNGSGVASNTDFDLWAVETQAKVEVDEQDTLYLQALRAEGETGDRVYWPDPDLRDPELRVRERLQPVLVAGWHRSWNPDQHTLVLAGWLDGSQEVRDPNQRALFFTLNPDHRIDTISRSPSAAYLGESRTRWLTLEAQQRWRSANHTVVAGIRGLIGQIDAESVFAGLAASGFPERGTLSSQAGRFQAYALDTWRPWKDWTFTAGASFDWLTAPVAFRDGPVGDAESGTTQLSPKVGAIWDAATNLWVRASFTRELGGVGFEESFRLEPTQVAGFNQRHRGLIPPTVSGALVGERMTTASAAVETRLGTDVHLGIEGSWSESDATRRPGTYRFEDTSGSFVVDQLYQQLEWDERSITAYAGWLAGRQWSLLGRYRLASIAYDEAWEGLSDSPFLSIPGMTERSRTHVTVQQVGFGVRYHAESGWYAGAESSWWREWGHGPRSADEVDHLRLDLLTGYRFARRRAEVEVGMENLLGDDPRPSPLTVDGATLRERAFVIRARWAY